MTPTSSTAAGNYAQATQPHFISRSSLPSDDNPSQSAVSWGAIFAAPTAAAALSLILLVLGTGLGLSVVSPWAPQGISVEAFGVSAIVWITAVQLPASGMSG